MGDALSLPNLPSGPVSSIEGAIALMTARNFTPEEYGRYHPGGQIGRNLRLRVVEAFRKV